MLGESREGRGVADADTRFDCIVRDTMRRSGMVLLYVMIGIFTFAVLCLAGALVLVVRVIAGSQVMDTEPVRLDDLPILQCPQCGGRWQDDNEPQHFKGCAVAYIRREARVIE